MYNACPLLDNFIEYGKKKEERKESRHLMRLLDNKSSEHFDAEYQAMQKQGLYKTPPDTNFNQGNEVMARTYSIHEEGGQKSLSASGLDEEKLHKHKQLQSGNNSKNNNPSQDSIH